MRLPGITKEERESAWQRVHADLIGVGPQLRTIESLQRKKECWFSDVKNKVCPVHNNWVTSIHIVGLIIILI